MNLSNNIMENIIEKKIERRMEDIIKEAVEQKDIREQIKQYLKFIEDKEIVKIKDCLELKALEYKPMAVIAEKRSRKSLKNRLEKAACTLVTVTAIAAIPLIFYHQNLGLLNHNINKTKETCTNIVYEFKKDRLQKFVEKYRNINLIFYKADLVEIFPSIKNLEPGKYSLENLIYQDSTIVLRNDFSDICSAIIFELKDGDKPLSRPLGKDSEITSGFGWRSLHIYGGNCSGFHYGWDLDYKSNSNDSLIYATADGIVTRIKNRKYRQYGKIVEIYHGGHKNKKLKTLYGHCKRILVKKGQKVRRGDEIAIIGMTGRATGVHVHYEARLNEKPVNPIILTRKTFANEDGEEIADFHKIADLIKGLIYKDRFKK